MARHVYYSLARYSFSLARLLTVYSENESLQEVLRPQYGVPISVALAPGASPCPTRGAVHATRIIANGEVYCEHAGV